MCGGGSFKPSKECIEKMRMMSEDIDKYGTKKVWVQEFNEFMELPNIPDKKPIEIFYKYA
jgi:hypothetical protein